MSIAGNGISLYEIVSVDRTPAPLSQRFPVANFAVGFMTDVVTDIFPMFKMTPPFMMIGALLPVESSIFEPSTGQIWPR